MLKIFSKLFLCLVVTIIYMNCDEEIYRWEPETYPNLTSQREAKYCTGFKRNPPSNICDPDDLLTKQEAKSLDLLINAMPNNTKCLCESCPPNNPGLNIKVALLKYIKPSLNVSLEEIVEKFAERTRRNWQFGGDCHNDVLIFVAALDDQIFISMGSKAKEVITTETQEKIVKETRAHFTNTNYFQGLESIIASYQDATQNWSPQQSSKFSVTIIISITIAIIVIIALLLIGIWFCVNRQKNSLSNSFEFIGSWGKNRNKHKTHVQPKSSPIYRPVKPTIEKIDETNETAPMKTRDPNV